MKDQVVFDGLRIDQAKYGLGVYATKSFAADEFVGQVHGSVICDPDHSSEYCIALTDRVCLEPVAPFRFLNHSCEPNCILWQLEVEDIRAVSSAPSPGGDAQPIIAGEQLTIDYASAPERDPRHCGSPTCRGWIVDEHELKNLPEQGPQRPTARPSRSRSAHLRVLPGVGRELLSTSGSPESLFDCLAFPARGGRAG